MKTAKSANFPDQYVEVFQLRVTLLGTEPAIWRRILVPVGMLLSEFHSMLQVVMGWTDSHLHSFSINGLTYSNPEFDLEGQVRDERTYSLYELLAGARHFSYTYDFGDNWQHKQQA